MLEYLCNDFTLDEHLQNVVDEMNKLTHVVLCSSAQDMNRCIHAFPLYVIALRFSLPTHSFSGYSCMDHENGTRPRHRRPRRRGERESLRPFLASLMTPTSNFTSRQLHEFTPH